MSGSAERVRVSRGPEGTWELAEAAPAAGLEGLVVSYQGWSESSVAPLRRREVPSGIVTVILNLGVPLAIWVPGEGSLEPEVHAESFLARISGLPAATEFTGRSAGVQVDMTPLGAHMLLGLPMDELPEPVVALSEVLGPEGPLLTERLEGAADWEKRFDTLDAFILGRLAVARTPLPSVEWAWRAILASGGRGGIGELCERIGCSRRHLIKGFRAQVGVTPKLAAGIVRFNRATAILRGPGRPALAEVALACGYHDQSHMTREFRRFGGATPGAFSAAHDPGFLGVPEDRVNSVQDRSPAPA